MEFVTLSRAYMASTFFQVLLIYFHVLLMQAIKSNQMTKAKKYLWCLIPTYVLGYVTHYTILFFAGTVGITMIVWFLHGKYPLLKNYIITGVSAVVLGVIFDPVSVMGMLMKLGGVTKRNDSVFYIIRESFLFYFIPNRFLLFVLFLLCLASAGILIVKKVKRKENSYILKDQEQLVFWLAPLAIDMILVSFATTKDYFKSLYPMIMLMVVALISTAIKCISMKSLRYIAQAMTMIVLGIVLVCGFTGMVERKENEEMSAMELRKVLDETTTNKAILVRDHACGYPLLNELYRYEDTLVLTSDDGDLDSLSLFEDDLIGEKTLILLVDGSEETIKPTISEMITLGYHISQLWSDGGTMGAYLLAR